MGVLVFEVARRLILLCVDLDASGEEGGEEDDTSDSPSETGLDGTWRGGDRLAWIGVLISIAS